MYNITVYTIINLLIYAFVIILAIYILCRIFKKCYKKPSNESRRTPPNVQVVPTAPRNTAHARVTSNTRVQPHRRVQQNVNIIQMKPLPSADVTIIFEKSQYINLNIATITNILGITLEIKDFPFSVTVSKSNTTIGSTYITNRLKLLKQGDLLHALNGN